jgi:hypothetical protein
MRLGAKGYRVTVIDRLDMPGGRGSSISQGGYRFDLGPTIVTVPQVLRELWAACGRDFDRDVDLRAMDPFYEIRWQDGSNFTARQSTDAMRAEVERAAHAVAAELGLGIAIEAVGHFDPVTFDPGLVALVRASAEKLGYSHMDIVSGAGHDACWINRVAPTVMIMCPCVGGLSHNEAEEISPEWAAAGTDVMLHAVLEVAEVVG